MKTLPAIRGSEEIAELPLQIEGETVEDYHKFLEYLLTAPGERTSTNMAQRLGLSVASLMELALRNRWVDRARAYDRQRLEALKVASASAMQEALGEMLGAVTAVAHRVKEAAPALDIGAHNVAQLVEAMGGLVKAMQAVGEAKTEAGGVSLRDVITIVTGATQARMIRGETGVEIITDETGYNKEAVENGSEALYRSTGVEEAALGNADSEA